jgi:hypothetical protein
MFVFRMLLVDRVILPPVCIFTESFTIWPGLCHHQPGPGPTALDTIVTHCWSETSFASGYAYVPGAVAAATRRREHLGFDSTVSRLRICAYYIAR